MRILAIDIGGSKIKCLMSDWPERRTAPSGPMYSPPRFVDDVRALVKDEAFDRVTIGFPAPIRHGRLARDPVNLGPGWSSFDYSSAFGCPVKVLNDAAMQAVGSYEGGRMLFLGLGTGLGSALIDESHLIPLELAHLPYRKRTYEAYLGEREKERVGKKEWREEVAAVIAHFRRAFLPDYVVLGGGNARELKEIPEGCRLGDNNLAFVGGFRVWDPQWASSVPNWGNAGA